VDGWRRGVGGRSFPGRRRRRGLDPCPVTDLWAQPASLAAASAVVTFVSQWKRATSDAHVGSRSENAPHARWPPAPASGFCSAFT
jgi:hypothetical protein